MLKSFQALISLITLSIVILDFSALGNSVAVSTWENDQVSPQLAFNPVSQEYLVVWEDHHWGLGDGWDIYGQRVSAAGALVGSKFEIAGQSNKHRQNPDLIYNALTNEFLVVYEYEYSETDHDIYSQRVSADGTLIGSELIIANLVNYESAPVVSCRSITGEYLILWEQREGSGEFVHNDIHGQWLSEDGGFIGSVITIQNSSLDESAPAMDYDDINDQLLIIWQEISTGTGDYNIHGQRLGGNGSLNGGEIFISTWENDQIKPQVAFNSQSAEFLTVWEDHHWGWGDDWDIYGQRLDNNGVSIGGNFGISWDNGNHRENPDVSWQNATSSYLVIWEYEYSPTDHDVYYRRVGNDGALSSGEIPLSTSGYQEGWPAIVATDGFSHLAVWEDSRDSASMGINIYGDHTTLPVITGNVYLGDIGTQDTPLANVTVELYGSSTSGVLETLLRTSVTDSLGGYSLPAESTWEYYNILTQVQPGYVPVGATSIDGIAVSNSQIQYTGVLDSQILNENRFWLLIDQTPLEIIDGPYVSDITTTSAVIDWQTNLDSDSWVAYDKTAIFTQQMSAPATIQAHSLTLTGLDPATTYRFQVQSNSVIEKNVQSRELSFETLSLPDSLIPGISINEPGTVGDIAEITALAWDNIGVAKVEFYINDVLKFIDYSQPYTFLLDTKTYTNGAHQINAKVFDLIGQSQEENSTVDILNITDSSVPTVNITTPSQDQTVLGKVSVTASLSDDTGLIAARFYVDGDFRQFKGWSVDNPPKNTNVEFIFDSRGESNGQYRLAIEVYDKQGKVGLDTVDVIVNNTPPPPTRIAWLTVSNHTVTRSQNSFSISITLKNTGDLDAYNISILDGLRGFQPISVNRADETLTAEHNPFGPYGYCRIRPVYSILPGQEKTYTFQAVPVLSYPALPKPQVGYFVDITWDAYIYKGYHNHIQAPVGKTTSGVSIAQAHADAVKLADYLIVTNPERLFANYSPKFSAFPGLPQQNVNRLLSTMAHLASLKNGVLGFTYSYSGWDLKKLISPSGGWSSKLHANFSSPGNGYLLLVGETEIIQGAYSTGWDIDWTGGANTDKVNLTDNFYANTSGNGAPDLSVGRIIGDSAANLTIPIQTSINVHESATGFDFDRSNALVVSGTGNGQDTMVGGINNAEKSLDNQSFITTKLHWKDYPPASQWTQFSNDITDNDVVHIYAHGFEDCIDAVCTFNVAGLNFGNTNPFIFAASCTTGNYELGNDENVAEIFLAEGAGVYIGSTEFSHMSRNYDVGPRFYDSWDATESIGKAFVNLERDRWGHSHSWRFWVTEYNLYGDPKYGRVPPAPITSGMNHLTTSLLEPVPAIDIIVPDYQVININGVDRVTIPDGDILLEPGEPEVPYYSVTLEYPADHKIQNVALAEKTGMETNSGLLLPTTNMDITATSPNNPPEPLDIINDWFPDQDYRWETMENPDGSTTLLIIMYAFNYNPLTTDVQFYKNFHFDIEYTVSSISITSLKTDMDVYQQGSTVTGEINIDNYAGAQDVVVSAVVKKYGAEDIVAGLLLETLKNLSGKASFAPEWNSDGFAPGLYNLETTLHDTNGDLLDQETKTFKVGIYQGTITELSATPEFFSLSEDVAIHMAFQNTGTVEISGTAIIKVINEQGEILSEFEHAIPNLMPSQSISFNETWNASDISQGSIISYVLFDNQATEVKIIDINKCGNSIFQGDVNEDCYVNLNDYHQLAAQWLDESCENSLWCNGADINKSTEVDLEDLQLLVGQWLWCNDQGNSDCDIFW